MRSIVQFITILFIRRFDYLITCSIINYFYVAGLFAQRENPCEKNPLDVIVRLRTNMFIAFNGDLFEIAFLILNYGISYFFNE